MRNIKLVLICISFILLLTATAMASTTIDFRGSDFSDALDQPWFTYTNPGDGLEVELVANPYDPIMRSTRLWWDDVDGIGIQSLAGYDADEIEGGEMLQVNFSSSIFLDRIHITDLFNESGYMEIGRIQVDTNTPIIVQGIELAGSSNGELWVDIGLEANFIQFTAPGKAFGGEEHEFSVAGFEYSPVPIPSAMLLFGPCIAGIVALRRRKRM